MVRYTYLYNSEDIEKAIGDLRLIADSSEADRRDWQGLYRRLECVIYDLENKQIEIKRNPPIICEAD
jgi:hypothetical protein